MKPGFALACSLAGVLLCSALEGRAEPPAPARTVTAEDRSAMASEKRTALVIGNGDYADGRLVNPPADARLMERTLRDVGFKVTVLINADQRQMKAAIAAFGQQLQAGGVGLFYFAGHGMQVQGNNYLIPVRAKIRKEADVDIEGVRVDQVFAAMDGSSNRLNIVLLDACRNNPFARATRSGTRGLAYASAPAGMLIGFATAPGSVAQDGSGANGTYTAALVKHLKTPGLAEQDVLMEVRKDVQSATSGQQVPWDTSSLTSHFYFVMPPECPAGTMLRGGQCVPQGELVCPEGSELREGKCVGVTVCPAGTQLIDGTCQGAATCPPGMEWKHEIKRCVRVVHRAPDPPKPEKPRCDEHSWWNGQACVPLVAAESESAPRPRSAWKTPLLIGGASLVGVGALSGITAIGLKASLGEDCDGKVCYEGAQGRWEAGRALANVATGTLIAGGVLLGVGLLLPSGNGRVLWVRAQPGGGALEGTF